MRTLMCRPIVSRSQCELTLWCVGGLDPDGCRMRGTSSWLLCRPFDVTELMRLLTLERAPDIMIKIIIYSPKYKITQSLFLNVSVVKIEGMCSVQSHKMDLAFFETVKRFL